MAGLGFLSGVSSLAIIYWWLRPHRLDARKRLRALESKLKDMEKYQLEINTIKRGLVEREASTTQKLLSINKQLAASQAGFREQLSKHDNLISTVTAKLIPPEPSALGLHPTPPPVSPADEVTADYSAAVQRNDRATIRELTVAGLNITQESEEAMTRGTSTSRTQLQVVTGGGSYLLIQRGGRHWLCPTAQTLESFTTNKPQKGIYDYEEQTSISFAELKKPAEVMQVDEGIWEVISKGIVLAPI
ncbi:MULTISPECIES: hypothetical protein [unclassified Synechococcus]|nr:MULTISPECIES: hypothetical protein [unclassified Synechococcus]APD48576.1 hypothetical protein BM449_10480 [Synechococcus sp. SynAce01]TWB95128.1 hypothetical protein FB106_102165 [Synechococcus sp. Ace-Pa]